jgi:hypothetical protein
LTVDELRSAIAHELGHFMGGDTRLTTFAVRTHALFESLVSTTQRDPFREGKGHYAVQGGFALAQSIAQGLVRTYGRLYLRVTMSTSRRQELAADALSASIVGGAIAARALEKVEVLAPMYMHYVNADVGHAVSLGAMPKDLTAAFDALRERKLAGDAGRALVDAAHRCVTGPFDSHPALGDRVRALASNGDPRREPDERIASLLFADPDALDAWLVDETRARVVAALSSNGRRVPTTRALAWSSIAGDVYVPEATQAARRAAERLHAQFPNATTVGAMFASVWRAAAQGKFVEVALRVHPALGRMPRQQGERAAVRVIDELLTILMRGAILERGGTMEPNLGEGAVALRLGDEHVVPAALLRRLSTDPAAGRAALDALATRLERVAD